GYTGRPFDVAKGRLPFPAIGKAVASYGQPIAQGRTHKGLTLETAQAAQVIAPYEGNVAFAGPFRGYGELLIIEHNGGYHTLLAGMARIDVAVGQWVLVGEPVGTMGREGARTPALYLEIRRKGQPINPLPWLAVRKGKVSG
ncbi:MAG: peptidoglycan DD-metalloendopeptidase family protein, partial [Rhodospirillaceae bacterium]